MTTPEIEEMISEEINNIRKYATHEEIEKLDSNKLNGRGSQTCIYGLMTGDCFSDRAHELLGLCARPYSSALGCKGDLIREISWASQLKSGEGRILYSAIEYFLYTNELDEKQLIERIKA